MINSNPLNVSISSFSSSSAATGPTYSSGTIGAVGASEAVYSKTVEVTFSENMATDSDYTTGVTIMVGSVSYTGFSGAIQSDKSKVRYVLVAGVDGTESVTWAYLDSEGGIKSETGGVQLGDVSAQAVTNTAFKPADLSETADHYWWHVRPSGSDNGVAGSHGAEISSWPEDGGSNEFVQDRTDEYPILLRDSPNNINGLPVLNFDGTHDNMAVAAPDFKAMFGSDSALKTAWFVV